MKKQILICWWQQKFTDWVKKYEEQFPIVYSVDEEEGYGFRHLELPKGKRGGSQGKLEDEMILMFTSGTTSVSKGVVMKNYNMFMRRWYITDYVR